MRQIAILIWSGSCLNLFQLSKRLQLNLFKQSKKIDLPINFKFLIVKIKFKLNHSILTNLSPSNEANFSKSLINCLTL